jgi:hypothetical protein
VANPYSKYLSYPNQSLRTRRDHKKYLGLIRSIAFLYQYQREVKSIALSAEGEGQKADRRPLTADRLDYIEVTLDDIDKANRLANEVLGQSLDELAKPSRTLLSHIYNMVKEIAEKQDIPLDEVYFTRRMIREYTNWTDWQVKTHIKQLEELEYLHIRIGARGKEYAYALNYRGQLERSVNPVCREVAAGAEDGHNNGLGKCYLNLTPVEEIKKLMKKEKT